MSIQNPSSDDWTTEASPALEFLLDAQCIVLAANKSAARTLGCPAEALVGRDFRDLLPRGGRLFFQSHVLPQLNFFGRLEEVYLSLRATSGPEIGFVMAGHTFATEQGERKTRLSLLTVSRRAIVEKSLKDAHANYERANLAERSLREELQETQVQMTLREHLASLGTLAAGIAHELNNPLTYVGCNLEMLESLPGLPEDALLWLRDAREGVERVSAIVAGLRVFSRPEKDRYVPLDLNAVARSACRLVAGQLNPVCHLETALEDDTLMVEGDEGRLVQVVVNLLVNAGQALQMAEFPRGTVRLSCRREGKFAVLEVQDNGPGVPEALRDRIFEPFVTTKPVGSGTGLGLYLARDIIASLRGTLELVAPASEGACFRIRMPAWDPQTQPIVTSPVAVQPRPLPSSAKPRILIVDDDVRVSRVLTMALQPWLSRSTESGQEALRLVQSGEHFDLIVCDFSMPQMSGREVLKALLDLDPGWKERFLFVSGGATDEESASFMASCPVRYLSKPVNAEQLKKVCAELLEGPTSSSTA